MKIRETKEHPRSSEWLYVQVGIPLDVGHDARKLCLLARRSSAPDAATLPAVTGDPVTIQSEAMRTEPHRPLEPDRSAQASRGMDASRNGSPAAQPPGVLMEDQTDG